jgi:UDP-glucose 4-epimerase
MTKGSLSLRDKSVLVTGGAGFIGSHLVDRIIDESPARIVVVDNFFLGSDENLSSAVSKYDALEVVRLDASDFPAMQDIVRQHKTQVVFDLATIPLPTSLSYPNWTIATNLGIATTFCELARLEEISHLVHLSSSEAYGSATYVPLDEMHPHNASTPYAASKSAGDIVIQSYVETYNINATIVRPFNNFGPRQNLGSYAGIIPIIVKRVVQGQPIEIYGDGLQTRDFIFVAQTADMILKIYETPQCHQGTYNVASGVETSINDLVRTMLEIMNVPDHPIVHRSARIGDVRRHCADVTKTSKAIGRTPTPIEPNQLMQTIEWYLSKIQKTI